MKIENYPRFMGKNRKIEQQKFREEVPPNQIYSVFGFSLVRILHARRKGASIEKNQSRLFG